MKRGEIRWYRFSDPDKKRPVLVLTRNSGLQVLREATVAPLTSTIRDIPTEVALGPEDGLGEECAVNLDHIQTVAAARLGRLITTLDERRMRQVREALLFALGFNA
jgi:mRNA interferase MazF